jgi:hypothetical protein
MQKGVVGWGSISIIFFLVSFNDLQFFITILMFQANGEYLLRGECGLLLKEMQ